MNMIEKNCEKYAERILNGDTESPDVLLHIQQCGQCRETAENIRFFKTVPKPEYPDPPKGIDEIIRKAAADATTVKPHSHSRIIPFLLWVGAAAAVFALSLHLVFLGEVPEKSQDIPNDTLAEHSKTMKAILSSDWDMSELNTVLADMYSESMNGPDTTDLAKNAISTTKLDYDYALFARQDPYLYH